MRNGQNAAWSPKSACSTPSMSLFPSSSERATKQKRKKRRKTRYDMNGFFFFVPLPPHAQHNFSPRTPQKKQIACAETAGLDTCNCCFGARVSIPAVMDALLWLGLHILILFPNPTPPPLHAKISPVFAPCQFCRPGRPCLCFIYLLFSCMYDVCVATMYIFYPSKSVRP